jgi:NitT/TauT family transport system substrate-binding protein
MIEARKGIGGATTVPIVYSEKFSQNRAVAVAFLVAYMRGVRVYIDAYEKNLGKDRVVRVLAKALELPEPLVAKMNMPYLDPNQRIDPNTFEIVQQYYLDKKWLREKIDVAKLVDTSYAEEAVKILGEYK